MSDGFGEFTRGELEVIEALEKGLKRLEGITKAQDKREKPTKKTELPHYDGHAHDQEKVGQRIRHTHPCEVTKDGEVCGELVTHAHVIPSEEDTKYLHRCAACKSGTAGIRKDSKKVTRKITAKKEKRAAGGLGPTKSEIALSKASAISSAKANDVKSASLLFVYGIDGDDNVVVRVGRDPHDGGKWSFATGKAERDETPKAAGIRELKEEMELMAHPDDVVPVTFKEYKGADGVYHTHLLKVKYDDVIHMADASKPTDVFSDQKFVTGEEILGMLAAGDTRHCMTYFEPGFFADRPECVLGSDRSEIPGAVKVRYAREGVPYLVDGAERDMFGDEEWKKVKWHTSIHGVEGESHWGPLKEGKGTPIFDKTGKKWALRANTPKLLDRFEQSVTGVHSPVARANSVDASEPKPPLSATSKVE